MPIEPRVTSIVMALKRPERYAAIRTDVRLASQQIVGTDLRGFQQPPQQVRIAQTGGHRTMLPEPDRRKSSDRERLARATAPLQSSPGRLVAFPVACARGAGIHVGRKVPFELLPPIVGQPHALNPIARRVANPAPSPLPALGHGSARQQTDERGYDKGHQHQKNHRHYSIAIC